MEVECHWGMVCNGWVRGMDFESNLVVGKDVEVNCNHVSIGSIGHMMHIGDLGIVEDKDYGMEVGNNKVSLGRVVVGKGLEIEHHSNYLEVGLELYKELRMVVSSLIHLKKKISNNSNDVDL